MSEVLERFRGLVEKVLEGDIFELVDIEEKGGGKILRLYIDRPGGVTLDECARVSEKISERLDMEDFIPYQYTLEVSSPGLERVLKTPYDFEYFKSRDIKILTKEKIDGKNVHRGKLVGYFEDMVRIEKGEGVFLSIPFSQIKKANLEVKKWE